MSQLDCDHDFIQINTSEDNPSGYYCIKCHIGGTAFDRIASRAT